MYFYEIGYSDHDGYESQSILIHNNKYSKSEFDIIVCECYTKASNEEKDAFKSYITTIPEDEYHPEISILNSRVVELMITDFGFKYLYPEVSFKPTTSGYIIHGRSKSLDDKDFDLLQRLFTKTVPRNEKINSILNNLVEAIKNDKSDD